MFAVIFKASVKNFDDEYSHMANALRELAITKYNCRQFIATTEGKQEIAISYWDNEQDIINWKKDSQHLTAQQLGRERWYQDYEIEVVEIKRSYRMK